VIDDIRQYPNLFQETIWPWGPQRVKFETLNNDPPQHLIANVNVVPRVGNLWLIIRLRDETWEIPGGTLEPGEDYLASARRELLEEAGGRLLSLKLFGAWRCVSLAPQPYRPHLPWPESYRVVGLGEVEIVRLPENPSDGEQVISVEAVPLETAVERFQSIGRPDLAELYQLASKIKTGQR
jgi:8-oxo-dGTP pyrophosphatase MutT (NUDIX family)